MAFSFGIFKSYKDGGPKGTSFYPFGGAEVIFPGAICIIAACVLHVGAGTSIHPSPSQQAPHPSHLLHFHCLPIFIQTPGPVLPAFLIDEGSILFSPFRPPYFTSGSHRLSPEQTPAEVLSLLSRSIVLSECFS